MALANPFDSAGKTVILAGATGGLGRPIAAAFSEAGANLAMCARGERALLAPADELKEAKGGLLAKAIDRCNQEDVAGFTDTVRAWFNSIDIDVLVTLVVGLVRKPSADNSLTEWQQVMDVNLKACWLLCQAVGRVMIELRRGRIINFSSNVGPARYPGLSSVQPREGRGYRRQPCATDS